MLAAWAIWYVSLLVVYLCVKVAARIGRAARLLKRPYACIARHSRKRHRRVLLLGLDNAGKTSVCQRLGAKGSSLRHPRPQHHVLHHECHLPCGEALDLIDPCGDWCRSQVIWEELLCSDPDAVLFVVDAADRGRLDEARKALQWVLRHPAVRGLPMLILGNKVDLPPALETWEFHQSLGLAGLSHDQREALLSSPLSDARCIEKEVLPKDLRRRIAGFHPDEATSEPHQGPLTVEMCSLAKDWVPEAGLEWLATSSKGTGKGVQCNTTLSSSRNSRPKMQRCNQHRRIDCFGHMVHRIRNNCFVNRQALVLPLYQS